MHFEVKYCILPSFQKIFSGNLNGYDTELGCLISKEDTAKFFFFFYWHFIQATVRGFVGSTKFDVQVLIVSGLLYQQSLG